MNIINRIKLLSRKRKHKREFRNITPQKVRRLINQFFINEDIYRSSLEITDAVVKNKFDYVHVCITLQRPGILIGKGGKTIDGLKKYLQEILKKDVVIDIKESKLWW